VSKEVKREIALALFGSLGCDKCDEELGDYEHTLEWDEDQDMFVCTRNPEHKEAFGQATRLYQDNQALIDLLNNIATLLSKECCLS